jgi:hypothetical protein
LCSAFITLVLTVCITAFTAEENMPGSQSPKDDFFPVPDPPLCTTLDRFPSRQQNLPGTTRLRWLPGGASPHFAARRPDWLAPLFWRRMTAAPLDSGRCPHTDRLPALWPPATGYLAHRARRRPGDHADRQHIATGRLGGYRLPVGVFVLGQALVESGLLAGGALLSQLLSNVPTGSAAPAIHATGPRYTPAGLPGTERWQQTSPCSVRPAT